MQKIQYTLKALETIHHGSDFNGGITRTLRREKVLIKQKQINIPSRFNSTDHRREAVIEVFRIILGEIFNQELKQKRAYGIYDEFASKAVNAACQSQTKYEWLQKILDSFGVRSLNSPELVETINLFHDIEFLQTIKDEIQYLMLLYRALKDQNKEAKAKGDQITLFQKPTDGDFKIDFTINRPFVEIPYIHGNSIRGYLRRQLMYDFCKLAGITKLDKVKYHQLFSGGSLTESGSGNEDKTTKELWREICPPIILLGSAVGDTILQGYLKVGAARPKCAEHGTGELNYWQLLETKYNTRRDDSKSETQIEVIEEDLKNPQQMIYYYEVFSKGTEFTHWFNLLDHDPLITSCFWRMIETWKEAPFICGSSSKGNGLVDLDLEVPEGASKLYLEHIENSKEAINDFFNPAKKALKIA